MRLLLTAAGAGAVMAAVLLWLAARDLREPWRLVPVPTPDPEDYMAGVQVDVRLDPHGWVGVPFSQPAYGTGDYWPQPWVNTSSLHPNT